MPSPVAPDYYINFVIPVYNRAHSLSLALEALRLQSDHRFTVVIADDGSTDKIMPVVLLASKFMSIRYFFRPHDAYNVALMRNYGAKLRTTNCTHIWCLDSDILLNKGAVRHAYQLMLKYPRAIIVGRYDWLPPLVVEPQDVMLRWDDIINARLPIATGNWGAIRHYPDTRHVDWDSHAVQKNIKGAALSGNIIVPVEWWERVGGFDDNIKAQGSDCDFGKRLSKEDADFIFCGHIIGYHIEHERDMKFVQESVQWTIQYMKEKGL